MSAALPDATAAAEPAEITRGLAARFRRWAVTLTLGVLALSGLTLLGWAADVAPLKALVPGWATIKPWTAVSLALLAVAIGFEPARRVVRIGCVGLVLFVTIGTMAQYLSGRNLGLDTLLFPGAVRAEGVPFPGRMSGATALALLLLACATLLRDRPGRVWLMQALAGMSLTIGLVAVEGYLLSAEGLYQMGGFGSVAIQTAIAIVVLALALLWSRPDVGVFTTLHSGYDGGQMARFSLPLAMLLPLLGAWAWHWGLVEGRYTPSAGIALFAVSVALLLGGIIIVAATRVDRADLQRRGAEAVVLAELDRTRLLSAVVETSEDAILTKTLDGTIRSWNRAAAELYGWSEQEAIGQHIRLIVPEDRRDELTRLMDQVRRGEAVQHLETIRRTRDGRLLDISLSLSPVALDSGELGVTAIARDITQRRKAEQRLRESEVRLQTILESLTEGLVVSDLSAQLLHWNRAGLLMHGFERMDDVLKPLKAFSEIFELATTDGQVLPQSEWPLARVIGGEELRGLDLRLRRLDRDWERTFSYGGTIVTEPGGKQLAVLTITDVTERTEATRAVERQRRELERSNRELAQFAYVASHDLQEPLRMVASYTELLANRYRDQVDERGTLFIGYIVDGARRMQALVRDLLSYARIDSQGAPLARTAPDRLVTSTRHDLAGLFREAGAELTSDPLPEVWADAGQLQQVFQNLVGNAIKFRGPRPPMVSITSVAAGPLVQFSVTDNGIGIDPQFRDRVFGMFQRLHGRDRYDGSGIGLSIARRIVERHGGTIWVESAPVEGTTVHFTLWPASGPRPSPATLKGNADG